MGGQFERHSLGEAATQTKGEKASLRIGIDVSSHETRLRLPVAFQPLLQVRISQPWRQLLRVEIGRHDRENIVMWRTRRRTGAAIGRDLLAADPGNDLVGRLGDLAFREGLHLWCDPVRDPVGKAIAHAAVGVKHGEGEALRALGGIGPRKLRRGVVTFSV